MNDIVHGLTLCCQLIVLHRPPPHNSPIPSFWFHCSSGIYPFRYGLTLVLAFEMCNASLTVLSKTQLSQCQRLLASWMYLNRNVAWRTRLSSSCAIWLLTLALINLPYRPQLTDLSQSAFAYHFCGLVFISFASTVDPCNPNPCKNGGICNDDGNGGYSCSCPPGWKGTNCDQGQCTNKLHCAVISFSVTQEHILALEICNAQSQASCYYILTSSLNTNYTLVD